MKNLSEKTKDIYNRNALEFDKQRNKSLFEKRWLDKLTLKLNQCDRILDVGCGSGEPISGYLIDRGFQLTGIDFSEKTISIASQRFPLHHWIVQDMRNLKLKQKFHAIIAWNSFFHLKPEEQGPVLEIFAQHTISGGYILLTIGPKKGEVTGRVNEEEVYSSSLSLDEYTANLQDHSFEVLEFIANDQNCNGHSILLAKKSR